MLESHRCSAGRRTCLPGEGSIPGRQIVRRRFLVPILAQRVGLRPRRSHSSTAHQAGTCPLGALARFGMRVLCLSLPFVHLFLGPWGYGLRHPLTRTGGSIAPCLSRRWHSSPLERRGPVSAATSQADAVLESLQNGWHECRLLMWERRARWFSCRLAHCPRTSAPVLGSWWLRSMLLLADCTDDDFSHPMWNPLRRLLMRYHTRDGLGVLARVLRDQGADDDAHADVTVLPGLSVTECQGPQGHV